MSNLNHANAQGQANQMDDRGKVILTFKRDSLDRLDAWRTEHEYRGTRTSLFRDAVELFMWLWEKHKQGAHIFIKKPDGTVEELTRFARHRID